MSASARLLIKNIVEITKDLDIPHLNLYVNELQSIIDTRFPRMANIQIGQKYLVTGGKAGAITVQVTKQNPKTWVMYELESSDSPGARWMMGKTWCKAERFELLNTNACIPGHVKVK